MAHQYITVSQASELLGFSTWTLYAWISQKKIPYFKLPGGSVRFDRQELIDFMERLRIDVVEDRARKQGGRKG